MPFTAKESLFIIFSSSASERGLITLIALFQRALSFKKKNIDRKVRKKEKIVDKVEVKTFAILLVTKEITFEIFSYKSKEIPIGNILFTELFIESKKGELPPLVAINS